ncbi:MAG: hypothetical protein DCC69_10095 [Hyphomicrobiales bacterium]|nr:MAG: hypothetical protein DCC69_10095 [Hyphomicrobiales bacterium]
MKIAAGVIGLILGLLVLLQSCTVATTAGLIGEQASSEAGMMGILVALLLFVGGGFAFGLPMVAAIVFTLAGLLGFAASGNFGDMGIWGVVALALAAMSFFAWRSDRRKKANAGQAS